MSANAVDPSKPEVGRMRLAEPTSSLGAALHVWGMVDKRRTESRSVGGRVWWASTAYRVCWGALLVLASYVVASRWWS